MATSHLCRTPHPEKIPPHCSSAMGQSLPSLNTSSSSSTSCLWDCLEPLCTVSIISTTSRLKFLSPCTFERRTVGEECSWQLLTLLSTESPQTPHCVEMSDEHPLQLATHPSSMQHTSRKPQDITPLCLAENPTNYGYVRTRSYLGTLFPKLSTFNSALHQRMQTPK